MSFAGRISYFIGVGAIVATLGVGTCSTNARFNDVDARFNDMNGRIDDVNGRIDDVNGRIDDMHDRIDDIRTDIRELRALIIDAIKRADPAD